MEHASDAIGRSPAKTAARSRRRTSIGVSCVILLAWINIYSVVIVMSANSAVSAGERNDPPPFIFTGADALRALLWLISGLGLIAVAVTLRKSIRVFALGTLLACAFTAYATATHRPFPLEQYELGFDRWATRSVDVYGIRYWAKQLPTASGSSPIPSPIWPVEVKRLSPKKVIQLPAGRGIVLTWGDEGAWSSARKVFISVNETDLPPTEPGYLWRELNNSGYAALQQSD